MSLYIIAIKETLGSQYYLPIVCVSDKYLKQKIDDYRLSRSVRFNVAKELVDRFYSIILRII